MEKPMSRDVKVLLSVIGYGFTLFFLFCCYALLDTPLSCFSLFLAAIVSCPLIKMFPIKIPLGARCFSALLFFFIAILLIPLPEEENADYADTTAAAADGLTVAESEAQALEGKKNQLGESKKSDQQPSIFTLDYYNIQVIAPYGWMQVESENFDLQCISPKSDMYLSVWGYSDMDLAQDQTIPDFFELQNYSFLENRDNVTEIESTSQIEKEDKIIYELLCSGEYEGNKFYYNMFMVEFKYTDNFAWVLVSGMPSVIEKNRNEIQNIIYNIKSTETALM